MNVFLVLSSLPYRLIDESGQIEDSLVLMFSLSMPIARAIKNHALMLTWGTWEGHLRGV